MILLLAQAVIIGGLCAGLGWLLSLAHKRWSPGQVALIEAIESKLPQTQCGQCQYPGCRAYAAALAEGEAINLCPPGGESTLIALSNLLNRPAERLNASETLIDFSHTPAQVAQIREPECVGCTVCIGVCPVDAIIGAQGFMHGVLDDQCTGCELCVPPARSIASTCWNGRREASGEKHCEQSPHSNRLVVFAVAVATRCVQGRSRSETSGGQSGRGWIRNRSAQGRKPASHAGFAMPAAQAEYHSPRRSFSKPLVIGNEENCAVKRNAPRHSMTVPVSVEPKRLQQPRLGAERVWPD